jgi:flagellar biosynthetic protein FlhB
MAAPVLGLVVAGGAISNLLQVGMHFSSSKLQPRWSRLDPLAGMKRLLTPRSGVELIKGFAKVSVVTFSGWQYLRGRERTLFDLIAADPTQVAPALGELAYQMSLRMVATLAVLAALDYAYQRWQFERSLRMSKQEIKDEFRETEGNPETRAKIRQRQRQAARRRMMASVPKASVVITNPTHFAVALQYELDPGAGHERSPGTRAAGGGRSSRRRGGAPRVVAKGQDLLAHRIRQIAVEHAVPVVENAPLARTLYQVVEIDEEIPPDLYRAVAEVLALVWRLDEGRRRTA